MENLSNEQLQQYVTPATRIASARDLVSNPGYVSIVSMASGSNYSNTASNLIGQPE